MSIKCSQNITILMLILLYFYFTLGWVTFSMQNWGVVLQCGITTFTELKDPSTFSTTGYMDLHTSIVHVYLNVCLRACVRACARMCVCVNVRDVEGHGYERAEHDHVAPEGEEGWIDEVTIRRQCGQSGDVRGHLALKHTVTDSHEEGQQQDKRKDLEMHSTHIHTNTNICVTHTVYTHILYTHVYIAGSEINRGLGHFAPKNILIPLEIGITGAFKCPHKIKSWTSVFDFSIGVKKTHPDHHLVQQPVHVCQLHSQLAAVPQDLTVCTWRHTQHNQYNRIRSP